MVQETIYFMKIGTDSHNLHVQNLEILNEKIILMKFYNWTNI